MGKKFDSIVLSRRGVLKGTAAIVATAGLSGCGSNSDDKDLYVTPQENLVYDKEMKVCFSSGPYNCGAKCHHKIHYKNGRLLHLTSAGDIPRANSFDKDNSPGELNNPIQRRACVRGYGYIQRLYQPDRLKYPLMRADKNKPRGDLGNFKRVSWDEAVDAAARALHKAALRKVNDNLGYSPIFCRWSGQLPFMLNPKVAPCMFTIGNESTGACDGAKFDMVGLDSFTNNVSDRLNSDFIITWGLDPSRTTYYVEHSHWFNTVCKEQGTDIVVITPNYSDAAGMLSTGVKNYSYTRKDGATITADIPAWIPARPTTDGALAVAMAYVIYKNEEYDYDYIRKDIVNGRKSFGFFAGDQMVSTAPSQASETTLGMFLSTVNAKTPNNFTDDANRQYMKGQSYRDATFVVPVGQSFQEYLISLENDWGGSATSVPGNEAVVGDATYNAVLDYASKTTGIPAATIEALAFRYATANRAFLDVGGGPQRAWNGVEWVQMMIALCTMTGNIDREGGGAGYAMMSHADASVNKPVPVIRPGTMLPDVETTGAIFLPMNEWSQVALTGRDYRDKSRFLADIQSTCGLALDPTKDKLVEIDVWFMMQYNGLHTLENVNKIKAACDSIDTIIVLDQTMHPTATYADIIFPACSHYETEKINIPAGSTAYFKMDAPLQDRLYDTKTDNEIIDLIQARLNELGDYGLAPMAAGGAEATYGLVAKSAIYSAVVDPNNELTVPTYEEFNKTGAFDFPIPRGKSVPGMKHLSAIGKLVNTTGVVNFWQPLWGKIRESTPRNYVNPWGIDRDGFRNPTAKYQPNVEGFEEFFDNKNPRTGNFVGYTSPRSQRTYKLMYLTNKARNRAHTVFDNVAMLKDQFKQEVYINPVDAAVRGIVDGDTVYVFNDRGCTKLPAKVTHYIVPGVISIEHGAWYRPGTETAFAWIDDEIAADGTPVFNKRKVPVDIGGTENMLTLGTGTAEHYAGQAVSAHGGPCEISKIHPDVLYS